MLLLKSAAVLFAFSLAPESKIGCGGVYAAKQHQMENDPTAPEDSSGGHGRVNFGRKNGPSANDSDLKKRNVRAAEKVGSIKGTTAGGEETDHGAIRGLKKQGLEEDDKPSSEARKNNDQDHISSAPEDSKSEGNDTLLTLDEVNTNSMVEEESHYMYLGQSLDAQPSFTDLEKCLLISDSELYSNSEGVVVSRIPVTQEQFDSGLFMQNVDEKACYHRNHNYDTTLDFNTTNDKPLFPCDKVGSVFCSMCIFDHALLKQNYSGLPTCTKNVKRIIKKCKKTECINGAEPLHPIVSSFMSDKYSEGDKGAPSTRRNLILYDNVLGNDKARWMETLYNSLGHPENTKIKLRDFVLPGSHNSAAVDMSNFPLSCGGIIQDLNKLKRNQVAKCQERSIMDQLKGGIRYLDLRIVDNPDFFGLRYPLHHTYLIDDNVNTMEDAIKTINTFVHQHPKEFVVARIKASDCTGKGGWKNEFIRLREEYDVSNNIRHLKSEYLDLAFGELQGKLIFDIDGLNDELYFNGKGVSGDIGNHGDPFEIAREIAGANYRNRPTIFNVWSFFPAPSDSELANVVLNPMLNLHDGLEDWDANFQKHVWLMHSLIGWMGPDVNAIIRDRATTRKNIYHVATQLTLYRIFDKMSGTKSSHLDAVMTHDWVNEWDEKFEHLCPKGWILQGFNSIHDNRKEDRLWKFSCRRVDWIGRESYWYRDGEPQNTFHPNIWHEGANSYTMNSYDGVIDYGFIDCSHALTGFGGIHNNHHEDRKFWTYFSPVRAGVHPNKCEWTGYLNGFDGKIDWQPRSPNVYISKLYSVHNSNHEDRRWKFCTCTIDPSKLNVPSPTPKPQVIWKQLKNFGLCMGVKGNNGSEKKINGARIILEKCESNWNSQKWAIDSSGRLVNRYTGKCLEAGDTDNLYAKAFIWDCNSGSHQDWRELNDGRYQNVKYPSRYLGVAYCNERSDYRLIELRPLELGSTQCSCAQTWNKDCGNVPPPSPTPKPQVTWKQLKNFGLCMGVKGNNGSEKKINGARIILEKCESNWNSQKWAIDSSGRLVNRYTGKCLEAGDTDNLYAKAFINSCHSGSHQDWRELNDGRYQNVKYPSRYLGVAYCNERSDDRLIELRPLELGSSQCGCAQTWNKEDCGGDSNCCSWNGSTCGTDPWCNASASNCGRCSGGWLS